MCAQRATDMPRYSAGVDLSICNAHAELPGCRSLPRGAVAHARLRVRNLVDQPAPRARPSAALPTGDKPRSSINPRPPFGGAADRGQAPVVDVQAPAHRVRRRQARCLLSVLDMQTGPHKLHELRRIRPASVLLSLQTVIGTVGVVGLVAGCGLDAEPELETGQISSAATVSSFIKSSC